MRLAMLLNRVRVVGEQMCLAPIIQRTQIDKQCTVGRLGFSIVVHITANGFERLADNFFAVAKSRAKVTA